MNPIVRFQYIDLTESIPTWYTFPAPIQRVTDDHILYAVNWINDESVGAFWLNRRQNVSSYQICSTTGSRNCYEVLEHSNWATIFKFTKAKSLPSASNYLSQMAGWISAAYGVQVQAVDAFLLDSEMVNGERFNVSTWIHLLFHQAQYFQSPPPY